MILTLLALAALQAESYVADGAAWATQPVTGRCYVELAAKMEDPSQVRNEEVRRRLRDAAQNMAGLASRSFYSALAAQQNEAADMAEARDFLANGIISQSEFDQTAATWEGARTTWRELFAKFETSYPACDLLRPLRSDPRFWQVVGNTTQAAP